MAELIVRDVDQQVERLIRARAKENGRSVEEEVRVILSDAVRGSSAVQPDVANAGLGTRFSRRFKDIDEPLEIPDFRSEPIQVPKFRK
jgi:plasmid stability protein